MQSRFINDDDFTRFHITEIFGAHQIKRAGLRSDHPSPVELTKTEGPESSRITDGDHLVACQHDQAVSTLDTLKGMNQGHFKTIFQMRRHKMNEDLAVHGGLENGTPVFQLRSQLLGIDQVAIMPQGVILVGMMNQKRLGIGDDGGACRGIADMADGQAAGQFGQGVLPENLGNQAHALTLPDLAAVRRGDPGAFLPPVLEGKETEEGHPRRLLMSVNSKDAAFLPGFVPGDIQSVFFPNGFHHLSAISDRSALSSAFRT